MTTKPCNTCGLVKPLEDFPAYRGGRRGYCRACKKAKEATPEYKARRNERRRERWRTDESHRQQRNEYNKARPHNKASEAKARKKQWAVHRERCRARNAIHRQVKHGRRPHPSALLCVHCSKQASQYHHFAGYSREARYKVEPVCDACHMLIHRDDKSPA